jgi:TfoX/Sxy family transcriptional regulator of competence genes
VTYDQRTAERVRRLLSARPDVVEKRMVGGRSFMVSGNLCCGVTGSALMVRVGRRGMGRALAEPHTRPMAFGDRVLAGYVCVEPAGYQSEAALTAWLQRGLDFVSTLPAKKAAAKSSRSRAPRG